MSEQNHTEEVESSRPKTPASVDDTGSPSNTKSQASIFRVVGRWLHESSGVRFWLVLTGLLMLSLMVIIDLNTYSGLNFENSEQLLLIIVGGSIGGLLLLLLSRLAVRALRYGINGDLDELTYSHIENQVVKTIIERLRQRSRKLTVAARIVLVAIVIMIGVGVITFVFADRLARSAQIAAMEDQIALIVNESIGKIVKDERKKVYEDFSKKAAEILIEKANYGKIESNSEIELNLNLEQDERLQYLVDRAYEPLLVNILLMTHKRRRITRFPDFHPDSRRVVSLIQKNIEKVRSGVINSQAITADMVSGITTRIGAILLVLFLVQIMVTLYRYNTRLAAFYDARADALELLDSLPKVDFEALVALTSPETLDFGKAPKTPMSEAVELAKTILAQAAKKKG